ncbi:MAG: S8 family serine peptidase [Acidobacteriia bacterium]|nr:S8 family serine peptidase [Terriglobia bacterium]
MKRISNLGRIDKPVLAAAVLAGLALVGPAAAQDISDSALRQMAVLLQEKDSRTPLQQKLSSSLVYAINASRGVAPAGILNFGAAASSLSGDAQSGVLVSIKASVSTDLVNAIQQAGGRVVYSSAALGAIRARVPLGSIEALAGRADVTSIKSALPPRHNGVSAADYLRPRLAQKGQGRAEPQKNRISRILRNIGLPFFIGATSTQGLVTHGANTVQAGGVRGNGIRVGVLSDSAEAIPLLIGTGDLPHDALNVADIIDGPGTSEGSAMMEIVYDLAPGVQLFFASAFNSPESFADNIRLLRNTYHCDIIVDDVSYSDEGVFQDGVIAQAVNDVTQSGALYFSSAANSGNITNGTASVWEGDFANGGTNALLPGYTLHSFGAQSFNRLLATTGVVDLSWSDPLGNSTNDYDLFILNSAGTAVVASSTTTQNGPGSDPFEEVFSASGFPANSRVVIAAKAGALPRALHVDLFFGERLQLVTAGQTHGHNASAGCVLTNSSCPGRAFGVAAVAWNSAKGFTKPFPGGALNPTEPFSSDGPRRLFYKADGTPITPGNLLFGTNGGVVLVKPDIAAADGVSTRTPGFSPFFGTSAAAPHAAGVAALVKSANPAATGAQIFNALTSTALDIRAPGVDRDAGYGIVMAPAAVNAILH